MPEDVPPMTDEERHSQAFEPELIADPDERAAREARNGLRQFDRVIELVDYFLDPERPFRLRSSHLLTLHRQALDGLSNYAGNFRPAAIAIGGSKHQPVGAHQVPEGGIVRLRQRQLDHKECYSLGRVLPVAPKLDTSFYGWKRPHFESLIVHGYVYPVGIPSARDKYDSCSDICW